MVIAMRYLTYEEAIAEIKYWLNRLEESLNSSDPSAVETAKECVGALVEIGDLGVGHVLRRLVEKSAPDFRPILAKGAEILEPIEVTQ
jgi:hypothetical protein